MDTSIEHDTHVATFSVRKAHRDPGASVSCHEYDGWWGHAKDQQRVLYANNIDVNRSYYCLIEAF